MRSFIGSTGMLRKKAIRIMRNPHFWIICFLTVAFLTLYILSYSTIREKVTWLHEYRIFEYVHNIQGSLLYIPYIYAAVIFGWIGVTTVWVLSFSIILPRIFFYVHNLSSVSNNIVFMTVPVMLILLVLIILKWLQSERRIFLEREAQRQTFVSQVLKAHEDERKHIAQELHDDTIQTLLALTNQIQSSLNKERNSLSPTIVQQLDLYSKSIHTVTEDLRRLCAHLRPSILDDIGLIEAIRSFIDNFTRGSIETQLTINGENRKFSPDNDVIIYRFIQEALNNASRHSGATEVVVNIDFSDKSTIIIIKDNGKGFIVPKQLNDFSAKNKSGLVGMQERAKMLNGIFNVTSVIGVGTTIYLEF